jgi:hypothetical protein
MEMSTNFYFVKKIPACDFFDGRLEKFGVREHHAKDTNEQRKCLTDGCSYLWVYLDDHGFVTDATRFYSNGGNGPVGDILCAIAEAFDTDIASDEGGVLWKVKEAYSVYGRFAQERDPYAPEYPEE